MRTFITYTAARLLLFAAAFGLVYMLGARGAVGLVIALVISGLASYVLLTEQRDAMSSSIVERLSRLKGAAARLDEGAAKEDDPADPADPAGAPSDTENNADATIAVADSTSSGDADAEDGATTNDSGTKDAPTKDSAA